MTPKPLGEHEERSMESDTRGAHAFARAVASLVMLVFITGLQVDFFVARVRRHSLALAM